jgi:hypothetical protein
MKSVLRGSVLGHGETWVPRSSLTLARAGQRAWIAMVLMFPQPAQQMALNSYL